MEFIKTYRLFFGSIVFGVLLWAATFLFLPVEVIEEVKIKTILFIVSCYISLGLGFTLFKFGSNLRGSITDFSSFFKYLTIFLMLCFVLRWIDLFTLRDVSITNEAIKNRNLSNINNHNSNIVFVLASIFKSLYFFPFIIALKNKYRFNFYTICALVLLVLPLLEAFVFGNRKPFFELFLILIISIYYYKKPKINLKNISIVTVSVFVLITISMSVLLSREDGRKGSRNVRSEIVNGRYNDILKPKEDVLSFVEDTTVSSIKKDYALIIMQSGQYITHGFFEFNHIIDRSDLKVTKGAYMFYPFLKFFNKLGLSNQFQNVNPSPRAYVYLTAFGGVFLDFRWFTVLFFFLFGLFQRFVYDKSFSNIIHSPLLIYLAIINVFLPIMNYMRGAGLYPFVGFVFLSVAHYYFLKKSNEKSTNT